MKRILFSLLAFILAPALALAQTATPTATATYNPYVVGLAGFDLTSSSASPMHTLGIPYWGKEGVYLYGKAAATVTAGQWVIVNNLNEISLLDNTAALAAAVPLRVCVATAGGTTASPYIWVWCGGGTFKALVTNGVTAGSYLTTTAVDGTAGTTGVAISACMNVEAGVTDTRVNVRCPSMPHTYFVPPTPAATTTP
jgi:hypothetical protein